MKALFIACVFLSSLSSFAADVCQYRFSPTLAVTVTVNDRAVHRITGAISWDDKNVCNGDLCTEIYPGTFQVRYRDLTPPRTLGVLIFDVKKIDRRDDLGNRYRSASLFGNFVRNAVFTSVIIPEANLFFKWRGRIHRMSCRSTEKS